MKKTFKKVLALAMSLVLCLCFVTVAFAEDDEYYVVVRGDANCDGEVNATDALEILRCAVGYDDAEVSYYWADLNGDDEVNSSDALRVLQISVGSDDPITYSEKEILKFYSDALSMSCQATSEIYYSTYYYSIMQNDYDSEDYLEFGDGFEMTEYYVNGVDEDGYTAYDFCPSTWIPMEIVKDASISDCGDGYYEVVIVLNDETADYDEPVPEDVYWYTANYADCTASGFEDYYSYAGDSYFSDVTITAYITDGYVQDLYLDIPFEMHMSLAAWETDEYFTDVTEIGCIYDYYEFTF